MAVAPGEMVAIMGPSGCGKTTLLNCLSGLDTIDAGDVRIEGVSLSGMPDRERAAYRGRRMGLVFQFYNLLPVLTAVENVELPLLVGRVPARGARRRAVDALERLPFLAEASFVSLAAIAVGFGLGLVVSYNVVADVGAQQDVPLTIPWLSLGVIFAAVYVAALASTLLPALRAARVYPAEALRYE